MKPCATPISTLAVMMAPVCFASVGVNMETSDQRKKEMMSMIRPPYSCAAQPPGTCSREEHAYKHGTWGLLHS